MSKVKNSESVSQFDVRKAIEQDLKSALALLSIVLNDKPTLEAVKDIIEKRVLQDVKNDSLKTEK